jgi:hypothetical protein
MSISPTGDVIIHFKKSKILLLIAGGSGMAALGVWLAGMPQSMTQKPIWYVHAVGVIAALFFGLCTLIGIARLFRRGPALILDRQGMLDQSGGAAVGRLSWLEVRSLRVVAVRRTKFLVVDVHNPRQYLDDGNAWQRLLRSGNQRTVGSPIALSSSTLDIDFDELARSVEHFYTRSAGQGRRSPGRWQ